MRLQKHLHGFMAFVIILTCAITINELLKPQLFKRHLAPVAAPLPDVIPAEPASVSPTVRLVSLDFINGEGYTTLALKLRPGQPAPDRLLVKTRFYLPGAAEKEGWTSLAEIRRPFAAGRQVEVTAAAPCHWCDRPDTPKAGYFADVYVSALYDGQTLPESFGPPVLASVPVVVQAERGQRR